MDNQILSLYEDQGCSLEDGEPFSRLSTREDNLSKLRAGRNFDIILVGGGLTNALIAHEATIRGFSVLLLDSGNIGETALPWDFSSLFCLAQAPSNIIRAQQLVKKLGKAVAPHLINPSQIEIEAPAISLRRLVQRFTPRYHVDERLLVKEYILAARQEGAIVLDSVCFDHIEAEASSGCYIVQFKNNAGEEDRIRARGGGLVLDPSFEQLPPTALGGQIISIPKGEINTVYRRFVTAPGGAAHEKPFVCFESSDGAQIALINRAPGIYEGALRLNKTMLPEHTIDAIFAAACAEMGLQVQETLFSRYLFGRPSLSFAAIERRGIFYCQHRAPWDAFRSARRIVETMCTYRSSSEPEIGFFTRPLPGVHATGEITSFRAQARAKGIREKTIESCIRRWQGRVRHIAEYPNGLFELIPGVLRGELDMAVFADQARSVRAVIENSLDLSLREVESKDQGMLQERISLLLA